MPWLHSFVSSVWRLHALRSALIFSAADADSEQNVLPLVRPATGTHLDESDTLWLNGTDSLRPPVKKLLSHCRLIGTIHPAVKAVISRLESHLHECIRTETMTLHEATAVASEFQGLAIVLADEVGKPRFCVADACTELGRELPFELFRCGVNLFLFCGLRFG